MTDEEKIEDTPPVLGQNILLKERFEICFDEPLPDLDANGAKAYTVRDNINPQRELFALLCDQETSPRLSYLAYMKSIDSPYILKLIEHGIVEIENLPETIVLVYNKPTGPRVDNFIETGEKISSEVFKSLALSLLSACDVLKTFGLTHRAIRLDNIFYKDSSRKELVLGDCLASFPSMYQPLIYETVENLLCAPESRGNGTIENDLYAAGVVLLCLARNKKISSDLSSLELLKQKNKNSSYAFLSEGEKLHAHIVAVLRSLLDDTGENRCDYTTLFGFYEGKTPNLSSIDKTDRSSRALSINNEKCYTRKAAALAMLTNTDFGIEVIQSGKLLEWIKNGLENEKLYTKIEKQITAEKENPDKTDLLSKICIFLDYTLPLRYGENYLFPGGLAKTIFYNKKRGLPMTSIQNLISTDILKVWYQEQPSLRAPSNAGEFKLYISRNDFGYGLDRIMYDFDEDLPCQSPLLGKTLVNTPSRLLKALDTYKGDYKVLPFDKNIIAYLRCKLGKKIDGLLLDINANQDTLKLGAVIRLYASIQNKNGPAQLSGLTQWIINICKPLVESYHNIKYQKFLEQELLQVSKSGKIIEIVELLENEEARLRDRTEFSEALKTANFLLTEKAKILSGDSKIEDEARDLAFRFCSILAVLTMLSAFVFNLVYWWVNK